MKINFETLNANQNIDKGINSQNTNTMYKAEKVGGIALDISGTLLDNVAYKGQGKTAEEVMHDASQTDVTVQQNYMTIMSNSMSQEDFAKLQEKGFNPGEIDVATIVTVVDEIKATLAEAGVEITGYNDDLDIEKLAKITGSLIRAKNIADKLAENDVPVTKENVLQAKDAIDKAEQIVSLTEGATKYLVQNQKEPTINNMYLAQFSSITDGNRQGKGYYSDELPGYYSKKADDFQWDKITSQMENVIKEAGYEVKDSTMADAKWLVEKGIPLTEKTFSALEQIKSINLPQDMDQIINSVAFSLADGKQAKDALLSEKESTLSQSIQLKNIVNEISDQALAKVVEEGKLLNIRNLCNAQIGWQKTTSKEVVDSQKGLLLISAKRQLEEVRLQMTVQANAKLLRSGYSIETVELGKLVEDLKEVEQQQKEILFSGDMNQVEHKELLYRDTLTKVSDIPFMPVAVIGKVLLGNHSFTLNDVHIQGTVLKNTYEFAHQSYESLMTAPRGDLGDSIKKAFRNVDVILEDMNMEVSETNRRAVRILGYNSMYVNMDNMEAVKDADLALSRVMEKMTPATTLKLIREGINPLEFDVKELDEYLTKLHKDSITETEKYSKYLYKLEKSGEISKTEKQAYIGIYRLFHQIEKSDGAVIGSLVNQGADLSFKNLLSQVRNHSKKGMDYFIDDEFGLRKEVNGNEMSISQQIDTGFESKTRSNDHNKEKYYSRIISEIYDNLDPEKLAHINLTGSMNAWEIATALKNEIPDPKLEQDYIKEQFHEIRRVNEIDESVIQALIECDQPITPDNLMAANYLMQYRGSTFRQLFEYASKNDKNVNNNDIMSKMESDTSKLEQGMMKLQRNMTDQESAISAYENLKKISNEILEGATDANTSYVDIRSINMFCKQISMANRFAKKENYEVPVQINDEITSINLRIIHNNKEAGKVTATLRTEDWGRISAEFVVTSEGVSGYVACSSKDGVEELKKVEKSLKEDLSTEIREVKELYFVHSQDLDFHHIRKNMMKTNPESNIVTNSESNKESNIETNKEKEIATERVSTIDLYEVAKAFIVSLHNFQGNR